MRQVLGMDGELLNAVPVAGSLQQPTGHDRALLMESLPPARLLFALSYVTIWSPQQPVDKLSYPRLHTSE